MVLETLHQESKLGDDPWNPTSRIRMAGGGGVLVPGTLYQVAELGDGPLEPTH